MCIRDSTVTAYDNQVTPTNFSYFQTIQGSGGQPETTLRLVALTNWPNPSAPICLFQVDLDPMNGLSSIVLHANGLTNFLVAPNSGFSGTGTNFLSDSGFYTAIQTLYTNVIAFYTTNLYSSNVYVTNLTVVSNITFQTTIITNVSQILSTKGTPTALVGLTAITGTSTNCIAADSAPALDVSISPTW